MEFLNVSEIIGKAERSNKDFQFESKLQVIDKLISYTRNKRPYFVLRLRDITGEIPNCRKWTNDDDEFNFYNDLFDVGNIIKINGQYQCQWNSIIIDRVSILEENDFNLEEFVLFPIEDQERLIEKFNEIISQIKNNFLKNLLIEIFSNIEIKEKYCECPSSISKHHPYRSGNLQHTIGMLTAFKKFTDFYQRNTELNVDLIYTGVILHDIGKLFEYTVKNEVPSYNKDYALRDHISLGAQFVEKYIKEIKDFPKDLKNRILHIILSHHGRKEWGAPIEPQFAEAEIVHYLDMIDSRFKSV